MRRQELEKFLRQFEVLRGISVVHPDGMSRHLAPQLVQLTGLINIHGEPHLFEADINLNEFQSQDDCMRLAKAILTAFDKAQDGSTQKSN